MSDSDFEIIEPKDYTGKKDESYSHPSLVMSALKKVIENRSKEMRDGYWNTKFDRVGNAHKVWVPDTREEFIESVESLMVIEERDYDDDAIKKIKEIKDDLIKKFKEYCEAEKNFWAKMHPEQKQQLNKQGYSYLDGRLSEVLPFRYEYIRDKVESYTKIVSVIQELIKRLGDYGEEWFEN
jgi:hypothetical protein